MATQLEGPSAPVTPAAPLATRPARHSPLRALGIVGYDQVEPVVLAALATQTPLLLIGAHGTAKSLLLARLAQALGLAWRHYNASLVNYDDLIGYPVPEADGTLRFVQTPASIWDAEVVFVDELSRARPDMLNRLFPIIHERVVQGMPLPKLAHRWAAMNPPATDQNDASDYLGSEPLDPAPSPSASRKDPIHPSLDLRGRADPLLALQDTHDVDAGHDDHGMAIGTQFAIRLRRQVGRRDQHAELAVAQSRDEPAQFLDPYAVREPIGLGLKRELRVDPVGLALDAADAKPPYGIATSIGRRTRDLKIVHARLDQPEELSGNELKVMRRASARLGEDPVQRRQQRHSALL